MSEQAEPEDGRAAEAFRAALAAGILIAFVWFTWASGGR